MKTAPMINVGVSKDAIEAARIAIMGILGNTTTENETKRVALKALETICNVNHTAISGCTFTSK